MQHLEKLKSQGIIVSYTINEYKFRPTLTFQHDDGYNASYSLSRNDIEDIKSGDMFGILDRLVEKHLFIYKRDSRKIKLKKLNEI